MLSCGIVGLPNSGKSTLFNALLKKQIAAVAEYPYTTIEPNVGVVEVPDNRLSLIANRLSISKIVPAAIRFIDIAGLIKGASVGEGLGNQFLAHIREVNAIVHVVRVFENPNVPHVHGTLAPVTDIETVNAELDAAGITKPTIYVLNISEKDLITSSLVQTIELIEKKFGSPVVKICAKLEAELTDLSEEDQKNYLKEVGIERSVLDQLITASYKLLDLVTFFTVAGGKQAQAWPVKIGTRMIEAAGIVHTDFAKGFITAEVVDWQKLTDAGSRPEGRGSSGATWVAAREKGLVKTCGRSEEIGDGMVIEFKFNVW